MHKISIINSNTLLVIIFMGIQPSTCLPEPHSPTEGGDSPLATTRLSALKLLHVAQGRLPPSVLEIIDVDLASYHRCQSVTEIIIAERRPASR